MIKSEPPHHLLIEMENDNIEELHCSCEVLNLYQHLSYAAL